MDGLQFDSLIKRLGTTRVTRVHALRALAAGALAGAVGVGVTRQEAGAKKNTNKCKRQPGECETCKRGKCEHKNGKKTCKAGKITAKALGTSCSGGTCQNGACIPTPCSFVGLQVACSSSAQCCTSTTGAICEDNFCPQAGNVVCCQPVGGSCGKSCDCCGPTTQCIANVCTA